jgi:pimeloyl-ACP methyl ester carboxylesterase
MFAELAGDLTGKDDERPPLVLVHGLTFDRTTWRPALAALEAVDPGRRVLSLDLPGHGESPAQDSYRTQETVERLHAAVADAGLVAPVVVGHSLGAVAATAYAGEHPVTGIVNVDQSLEVEPFAAQAQAVAPLLEGPAFDQVWQRYWASMEVDLLPAEGQAVARAASRPRGELVRGYWADVIDHADETAAWARDGLALLRARRTPYEIVVGRPTGGERAWFARELPQATVTELPGSGHFPQLADPRAFAARLAATSTWRSALWAAA